MSESSAATTADTSAGARGAAGRSSAPAAAPPDALDRASSVPASEGRGTGGSKQDAGVTSGSASQESLATRPGAGPSPRGAGRVPSVSVVVSAPRATEASAARLAAEDLDAFFWGTRAVKSVTLSLPDRFVTAIIGPSGCGKSTLLRCLTRMHKTVPGARVSGAVMLDGRNIYGRDVNVTAVRQRVGMVFQRP